MVEKRIIVHGKVQGVFFRETTKRKATKMGLTGYVKNMPDKTVLVVASGSSEKIQELIDFCKTGPSHAQVDTVDVEETQSNHTYNGFVIRF